jgi:hypothetical protein
MSVTQQIANLENYQEELFLEIEKVQDVVLASEKGRRMLEAELQMAETKESMLFTSLFDDEDMSQEERDSLGYYFSVMFKKEPENAMKMFAAYMVNLLSDIQYIERTPIYIALASAAKDITETKEYQDYLFSIKEFNSDQSAEAVAARASIEALQIKVNVWSGM